MSVDSDQLPVTSGESSQKEEKIVTSQKSPQIEEEPDASSLTPQASEPAPQVSQKTQGVRVSRSNGAQVLHDAAKKAARSNSRNDVQEYMRLRRGYV